MGVIHQMVTILKNNRSLSRSKKRKFRNVKNRSEIHSNSEIEIQSFSDKQVRSAIEFQRKKRKKQNRKAFMFTFSLVIISILIIYYLGGIIGDFFVTLWSM